MNDLIIQRPQAGVEPARELFLLFHGVGATATSLQPLGESLAQRHPHAWVVSVQAPHASDISAGWQWFSVQGVTPQNRAARVAAAMPTFVEVVSAWQRESGLGAAQTTLVGFSQGAIMALESTQQPQPVAHRVVALSGRLASPARQAPASVRIHLLHGQQDQVVPTQSSVDAHAQLQTLGAQVSLDLMPGLGHGVDAATLARLLARLEESTPA
jgi:phospholipase/carboxylesterase